MTQVTDQDQSLDFNVDKCQIALLMAPQPDSAGTASLLAMDAGGSGGSGLGSGQLRP